MNNTVGYRIKNIRNRLDMKQGEFAKSISLSQAALSVIENGGGIAGDTIDKIVKTHNINPNYLINGLGDIFLSETKQEQPPQKLSSKEINYRDEIIEELRTTIEFLKAELQHWKEENNKKMELLAKY